MHVNESVESAHMTRAALVALMVCCLFYALDRTRAAWFEPAYDPSVVIGSARIDYFWRGGVAFFLGATAFFIAWVYGSRERAVAHAASLQRALIPVILFCTFCSVMWP